MHLTAGRLLQDGKYRVDAVLGVGKFGITYRATQTHLGQAVVLKTLNGKLRQHPDFGKFQQQFVAAAQRLALCQHPNIVRVLDFFEEGGLSFVVMDYIPGESLNKLVQPGKPLSEAEATHYIRQVASALKAVHQSGFLHRDIQPKNIIRRSGTHLAMLIDFGIARNFTPGKKQTDSSFASVTDEPITQYLPSEKLTASTDIYALAATFYYLLTGEPPVGTPLRDLQEFQPNLSPEIERTILQGLALIPSDRPQTVENWLSMLSPESLTTTTTVQTTSEYLVNTTNDRGSTEKANGTDRVTTSTTAQATSEHLVNTTNHQGLTGTWNGTNQEISSYAVETPGEYIFEISPYPLFSLLFLLTAGICGWMGFDLAHQYTATRAYSSQLGVNRSWPSLENWLEERIPNRASESLFEQPSVESSPSPLLELNKEPKGSFEKADELPTDALAGEIENEEKLPPESVTETDVPVEPDVKETPTNLVPEPSYQQPEAYSEPEPSVSRIPEPAEPAPAPVPEVIPLPVVSSPVSTPKATITSDRPPSETLPLSEPTAVSEPEPQLLQSPPAELSTQQAKPDRSSEPAPATPSSELLSN